MKKISILRFLLVGLFANMCMAMGAEKIGDFGLSVKKRPEIGVKSV